MPHQPLFDTTGAELNTLASVLKAPVSRRTFLGGMVGATCLSIAGCTTSPPRLPPGDTSIAYYNRSTAYHQQQIELLSRQGYRPISLSLYGNPAQPLYAAVWLKSSGNAWHTFYNLTAADYQKLSLTWTRRGYRPTILTATGVQKTAIFAGLFEEDATPFLVKYHLGTSGQDDILDAAPTGPTSIQYWQNWANNNNYILRWGALYGDAAQPLYAGVWEQNSRHVAWNWFSAFAESSDLFQQRLQAEFEQWVRPAFVAIAPDQQLWSIFRDDVIGPWSMHPMLTSGQYEARLASSKRQGYYPLVVQGSGSGTATRLCAIFVRRDQPEPRRWRATGIPLPSLATLDTIMQKYIQQYDIRGGCLAVARQGRLVFARGYTWAEPDYPDTEPTSLFRTASCTKPFTSIAIHQLIEHGRLTLDTPVQQLLQLTTRDGHAPLDSRFNEIRIWHLLSHAGGWDRDATFDPLFDDTTIAQALRVPLPITRYQMTTFMAGQPLQFDPGTRAVYSNFGYSLLGQVIEKLTGQPYGNALGQSIYRPLGLTRPRPGRTLLSQQAPGEVRYHAQYPYIAQSVMTPEQPYVPVPYGGTNQELGDASGDQVMAACDYARMLASFDLGAANPLLAPATVQTMWTEPPALAGSNILRGWFKGTLARGLTAIGHNGDNFGSTTMIFRRSDNISFVVFFNHDFGVSLPIDGSGNVLSNALSNAADEVSVWPDGDLFPSVGIPSFAS